MSILGDPSNCQQLDMAFESSGLLLFPHQGERLQILPAASYYIRRLLRQNWEHLQPTSHSNPESAIHILHNLDTALTQLYPDVVEMNAVVLQLEQWVLSYQNLWARTERDDQALRAIEEEIFAWLGYCYTPSSAQPTILIVDDVLENLQLITSILENAGYKVHTSMSGKLALALIPEIQPDLILLDILMPGMNGYQVCESLKANSQTQSIPVIFLSALDTSCDLEKIRELGGVNYIPKPFKASIVLDCIQQYLKPGRGRSQSRLEQFKLRLATDLPAAYPSPHIGSGGFRATLDGRYLRVNRALADLCDYESPAAMIAEITNIWEQVYVDPQYQTRWNICLEQPNAIVSLRSQIRCRNGSMISILESVQAVQDSYGNTLFYEGFIQT